MARRVTLPVRWSHDAQQDLLDARSWYSEEAPHIVPRFREAVRDAVRRIGDNPQLYPRVHAAVRRAVLHQFPYSIYYRFDDSGVLIVAIVHQSRSPRVWRQRI